MQVSGLSYAREAPWSGMQDASLPFHGPVVWLDLSTGQSWRRVGSRRSRSQSPMRLLDITSKLMVMTRDQWEPPGGIQILL